MTGMGRDGADRMLVISRATGITIGQDEESSSIFGLPKAAAELGAAQYVQSPDKIVSMILSKRSHGLFVHSPDIFSQVGFLYILIVQ